VIELEDHEIAQTAVLAATFGQILAEILPISRLDSGVVRGCACLVGRGIAEVVLPRQLSDAHAASAHAQRTVRIFEPEFGHVEDLAATGALQRLLEGR
jgi:hypothetical protein